MRNKILIVACFLIVSACSIERKLQKYCGLCPHKDSISNEVQLVYKDSLIYIPADSAWYWALLECDSFGNVFELQMQAFQGKSVQIEKRLVNNTIVVHAKVDSAAIALRWIEKNRTKFVQKEYVPQVKLVEKKLSALQRFLINSGAFLWGFIIVNVIIRIGKSGIVKKIIA